MVSIDEHKLNLSAIKHILRRDLAAAYEKVYGTDREMTKYLLALYHQIDRDEDKFNHIVESILEKQDDRIKELEKMIDKEIELLNKEIEHLEKLKKKVLLEWARKKAEKG